MEIVAILGSRNEAGRTARAAEALVRRQNLWMKIETLAVAGRRLGEQLSAERR